MYRYKNFSINITWVVLTVLLAFIASLASQLYTSTKSYAGNTLPGINEVIEIATTDGLPLDAPIINTFAVSSDGNAILFNSKASNLPHANGINTGLYVYSSLTGLTTRIDISSSGILPNGATSKANLSGSGKYVYFYSYATNLIDGITQYPGQTYVKDVQTGVISAMSNHYWSGQANQTDYPLGISDDGRFVLLTSSLTGTSYPYFYNVMLGDRNSNPITWTSVRMADSNTSILKYGAMSCDGALAVYQHNNDSIYFVDTRNGAPTNTLISDTQSISPMISCDGNYIAYWTKNPTEVYPNGQSTYRRWVLYNRINGERKYIDTTSSGTYDSANPIMVISLTNTGDALVQYDGKKYIKHISDGSGVLEPLAKAGGTYVDYTGGIITNDARYVFFYADPYDLGLATSPSTSQLIRAKTGL